MKRKPPSDAQFKHQVIFTIEGMKANINKIFEMFPEIQEGANTVTLHEHLIMLQNEIKEYRGKIIRRPK